MSISLVDYLRRKRNSLEQFIKEQNITSYDQILDYCARRGCEPISKETFDKIFKSNPLLSKKTELNKVDTFKRNERKKRSRKSSRKPSNT